MWELISEGSQLSDSQSLIGREVSAARMVEREGFYYRRFRYLAVIPTFSL